MRALFLLRAFYWEVRHFNLALRLMLYVPSDAPEWVTFSYKKEALLRALEQAHKRVEQAHKDFVIACGSGESRPISRRS